MYNLFYIVRIYVAKYDTSNNTRNGDSKNNRLFHALLSTELDNDT